MQLVSARVRNYRSIIDSNKVVLDPEMTCMVGMTGSGKTSFLSMVAGIGSDKKFDEGSLPNGSQTQQDFHDGKISAGDIVQLESVFEVEDADRISLPARYKDAKTIYVERRFDGKIITRPDHDDATQTDLEAEISKAKSECRRLEEHFRHGVERGMENLSPHSAHFASAVKLFEESDLENLQEFDLAIDTLQNTINSIPVDQEMREHFATSTNNLSSIRDMIEEKLGGDPINQLYKQIPKPLYKDDVDPLDDEISIDDFVANPSYLATFHSIAVITGLTPSGLQKIRNAKPAEQDSYLSAKSQRLSSCLNGFWTQENYEFSLRINDGRLFFLVSDATTRTETSVLERSAGFQWWLSFFLGLSTFLAKTSGRSIILLDNPATELHDEGKGDVLRFIRNTSRSDRLQIVYSTHERAMLDPWRTDMIRAVELTKDGTKIESVQSKSRHDLLKVIRRNIGSPAKYSLFGAPRTVFFEGISDTYIVSSVNEYMSRNGLDSLDRDTYSINAINGIDKAPETHRLHKELGIEFVVIVDSGTETENMKKRLDDGDWSRFIEIKEILNRNECDMEDMVDSNLYYLAFKQAYQSLLDEIPSIEEIDRSDKKRVTNYENWFKANGREYNKTLVAQQLFGLVGNGPSGSADTESFGNTIGNFKKLFGLIACKYDKVASQ